MGIVAMALATMVGAAVFLGAAAAVASAALAPHLPVGIADYCPYGAGNDDIYYNELHS